MEFSTKVGGGQGWKKSRSLRSGILDNSYFVRQLRPDPSKVPLLVRQIWPGFSFVICVCLVKTEMDNKHQITDCIMRNFVQIVKTINQALSDYLQYLTKSLDYQMTPNL